MEQQKRKNGFKPPNNLTFEGKLPPQAVDLEELVLGAILVTAGAMNEVVGILKPDRFYKEPHQKVFEALMEMHRDDLQIDISTVTYHLKKKNHLELVGGPFFVSALPNKVVSAQHIRSHAMIILEKYIQREIIRIGVTTVQQAYEDQYDVLPAVQSLQATLSAIDLSMMISAKDITEHNKLQENADVFYFNGRPLGSIGNIGTLIAPPGAGKSNVIDIICAKSVCEEVDGIGFEINLHGKEVYQADSERSENDIIRGRRRGVSRIFEALLADNSSTANEILAQCSALWHTKFLKETGSHEDNMATLERAISSERYKLVCVDMVTDWIADPNDIPTSRALVARLGRLASRHKCFILCTIHDNPAVGQEKATGYLGSELMKRSECVILMRRMAENKEIVEITTNFQFGKGRNTSAVGNSSFMEWDGTKGYFVTSAFQIDPHMAKKSNATHKNKELFERLYSSHQNMGMTATLLCSKYVESTGKSDRNFYKILKGAMDDGWVSCDAGLYKLVKGEDGTSPFNFT